MYNDVNRDLVLLCVFGSFSRHVDIKVLAEMQFSFLWLFGQCGDHFRQHVPSSCFVAVT